jgi:hypothetical protein
MVKTTFNINDATFDFKDYFLLLGMKGVVYYMRMEYQVLEMII